MALKPKKQNAQLKGLLMILVIAVLALAAVFVSQKLSSQQSVSPNAPESKPMAAKKCGDVGTSGGCSVMGGCGYGEMCTRVGGSDSFECIKNSKCPQQRICNASVSGKCAEEGGCLNAQRCTRVGDKFTCLPDVKCYTSGGGGYGTDNSCSRSSAANCIGQSDGDSCGDNGKCKALNNQLGSDGRPKCTCKTK